MFRYIFLTIFTFPSKSVSIRKEADKSLWGKVWELQNSRKFNQRVIHHESWLKSTVHTAHFMQSFVLFMKLWYRAIDVHILGTILSSVAKSQEEEETYFLQCHCQTQASPKIPIAKVDLWTSTRYFITRFFVTLK